jgi:hypothetical protein
VFGNRGENLKSICIGAVNVASEYMVIKSSLIREQMGISIDYSQNKGKMG